MTMLKVPHDSAIRDDNKIAVAVQRHLWLEIGIGDIHTSILLYGRRNKVSILVRNVRKNIFCFA